MRKRRPGEPRNGEALRMKAAKGSLYTHIEITCNTSTEGKRCSWHKDGTQHIHRVARSAVMQMTGYLGK